MSTEAYVLFGRVAEFYHKSLFRQADGLEWLKARGITDQALLETFRLGYAAGTLKDAIPPSGDTIETLATLGILDEHGQERFRGCVVCPLCNEHGQTTGLCGFRIDADGHEVIRAGDGVWNITALTGGNKTILIVASILEGALLWQAGHRNVTICEELGSLADIHVRLFKQGETERVILVLDKKTAATAVQKLTQQMAGLGVECNQACVPGNESLAEFVQSHSPEELDVLLNSAISCKTASNPRKRKQRGSATNPASDSIEAVESIADGFRISFAATPRLKARCYEVKTGEKDTGKLKATMKALVTTQSAGAFSRRFHIDTLDLYSARARRTFASDAAELYSVEPDIIISDLNRIIHECESMTDDPGKRKEPAVEISDRDRREAERFGKRRDLLGAIASDFGTCGYIGEKSNVLLAYLAMTSRKMQNALALLILSGSGTGKSALQDSALAFCPPEDLIKLTSVTARALFYKNETSLKHRVLALEEVTGAEHAAYAIRSLISAGVLIIETTSKDTGTGKMTTVENRVYGPTAVFQTTTNPDIDPETRSRFIVTSIDESHQQTQAILNAQRNARTLEGFQRKIAREEVLKRQHAFQRSLKPLEVVNPFGKLLTYTDDRLITRRDHPKYLDLIEAVAFLRQFQKPVRQLKHGDRSVDYIEVSLDDIATANELAAEFLGRNLDELNGPSRTLLVMIGRMALEMAKSRGIDASSVIFGRRDIREYSRWTDYQVRLHLKQLEALEYITPCSGRFGQKYRYRLIWRGEGLDGERFVLNLKPIDQLRKETELLGIDAAQNLASFPTNLANPKGHLATTLRTKNDM